MSQYFAYDYTGNPFILFGTWHLVSISFFILLNFAMMGFRKTSEKTRKIVRISMAVILWVNEAFLHIWYLYWHQWSIQIMLPLHACTIMLWLSGFMLIFKNYRIYEFAYFLGIGGAIQAFLTPDIGAYGFPHYRILQSQLSHGLLITAAIYMTTVEGFHPTWKSMKRVFIIGNIAMGIVFCINRLIGSNYMMINGKPSTASLLDLLPPWPVYIIFLELIGAATFFLLYLPFLIKDRCARTSVSKI